MRVPCLGVTSRLDVRCRVFDVRTICAMAIVGVLAWCGPGLAQSGRVLENQSFRSAALGHELRYSVYLPPGYDYDRRYYLTIYLLHGYTGDQTNWIRLGEAARTADSLIEADAIPPVILVMPDGKNSWYVDSDPDTGFGAYETAIVDDLVDHIDREYRTITERRGRMIAGLSMGGYGALHLAFKHPELFGAVASLSGALWRGEPSRVGLMEGAFGEPFDGEVWARENPFAWISRPKDLELRLPTYLTVGDDDALDLYRTAVDFYAALREAEMPAELRITDGGHGWAVWAAALRETLLFFSRVFQSRY
jgi:S-formylglutathione hydrolase FrmB